ncbi:MAG: ubiquitin-like domain-containing protein, partial [Oscillospiraceae bacterium]
AGNPVSSSERIPADKCSPESCAQPSVVISDTVPKASLHSTEPDSMSEASPSITTDKLVEILSDADKPDCIVKEEMQNEAADINQLQPSGKSESASESENALNIFNSHESAQPATTNTSVSSTALSAISEVHTETDDSPRSFIRRFFAPSNVAFIVLVLLLMVPIYLINYAFGNLYYISEGGKTISILFSNADEYSDIFNEAGLEFNQADSISESQLGTTRYLTVSRAYDVTVIADGRTLTHKVYGSTTAETLAQLGITVGEDDIVEPEPDKVLDENETITVKRVRYEQREVTEAVAWQKVVKPSPLIREGKTQIMNEGGGRDGLAYRTYQDKFIDGVLTQSTVIEEDYEDFPWNVVTLEGKSDAHMSPIDGSEFTDIQIVDNAPASYERVLQNAVCTAYSFKPGTFGASGMHMFQGFVAVNTNVIPYGSLLYITSPTGKFTYGWAIAADVGEAMMAGYVDIDLFFETYTESALFGKHKMNVYVVKQLNQPELEQYAAHPGMFRSRVPS